MDVGKASRRLELYQLQAGVIKWEYFTETGDAVDGSEIWRKPTWDAEKYRVNHGIFTISTGAGFLEATSFTLRQVAPYGELGRRFAVAKPKEVQRVRSRQCYWMVGSSTQGESGGKEKVNQKGAWQFCW